VASDEYLRHIDEHMKRIDEHMDRGNELMAEIRHEMDLTRDTHERNRVAFEGVMDAVTDVRAEFETNREFYGGLRQFVRDITRRNELVTRELIAEIRARTREILDRLPPATA
jgi:hypothetical protein